MKQCYRRAGSEETFFLERQHIYSEKQSRTVELRLCNLAPAFYVWEELGSEILSSQN